MRPGRDHEHSPATISRPDELRQELFSRSLAVTTAVPLARPDQVFAGLPSVQGWQTADQSSDRSRVGACRPVRQAARRLG